MSAPGRIVMMGALDNLVKGAAGQAVQNMNLLFGFDEAEGLLSGADVPVDTERKQNPGRIFHGRKQRENEPEMIKRRDGSMKETEPVDPRDDNG